MRYAVDGTDIFGTLTGEGDPRDRLGRPWAVHDAERQDWVFFTPFRTVARLVARFLNSREETKQ